MPSLLRGFSAPVRLETPQPVATSHALIRALNARGAVELRALVQAERGALVFTACVGRVGTEELAFLLRHDSQS